MTYDAHCHLDFPGVHIERLDPGGRCIAAADPAHWGRVAQTAKHAGCHFVLGIHPWFDAAPEILDQIEHYQPDGLGEIGLDRLRPHPDQLRTARLQLERAGGRLVVLHCVRAHAELLELLVQTGVRHGLVHGWTGSADLALRFVEQGLHLSFGPALLRSPKIAAAARVVPAARLLVESDGETTSELSRLREVIDAIAAARSEAPEVVSATTQHNAEILFPRVIP